MVTHEEIETIIAPLSLDISIQELIELLLWYGFLGVIDGQNRPVYIYDRAYDFRRLEAERGRIAEEVLYAINPAFLRGLTRQ